MGIDITGVAAIAGNFAFDGEFTGAIPYGSGHINDTYALSYRLPHGGIKRYILQRINHHVFIEPDKLMKNIEGITGHLRKKILAEGGDPDRETLNLIPTLEGKSYIRTEQGDYWRGLALVENANTYDIVKSKEHFYYGAKAFGKFQRLLSDYPAEELFETIADFHDTRKRFEAFRRAITMDPVKRAAAVQPEIGFAMQREGDASVLVDLLSDGRLPLRVTHNDTKFNNVLIDDRTGQAICVIDLDTVMPGLSLYDFGDSIRAGTNTAAEDEVDLTKVSMDLELFESFTKGFLEATAGALTPMELEHLPFGAKLMTFEVGIRFLTDYLNGDTYFKIHREGHNLDRARAQFKLVEDMEAKMGEMVRIVKKYS